MKKIIIFLSTSFMFLVLTGCKKEDEYKAVLKETTIDSQIIKTLEETKKIVIFNNTHTNDSNFEVISSKKEIAKILEILSRLTIPNGDEFTCEGHNYELLLHDIEDNIIDTIYVWESLGAAIPGSMLSGCNKYRLSLKDAKSLFDIIE